MIIKIPIYLEVEEKFVPEQVQEVISVVQKLMTEDILRANGKKAKWKLLGREVTFSLLTAAQVRSRITGGPKTGPSLDEFLKK